MTVAQRVHNHPTFHEASWASTEVLKGGGDHEDFCLLGRYAV
jgi:hypothetical protein